MREDEGKSSEGRGKETVLGAGRPDNFPVPFPIRNTKPQLRHFHHTLPSFINTLSLKYFATALNNGVRVRLLP